MLLPPCCRQKFAVPSTGVLIALITEALSSLIGRQCRIEGLGGVRKELDFTPLCDVAQMLYGSALVSERYAGISEFLLQGDAGKQGTGVPGIAEDERLLPVTRSIINAAGAQTRLA